MKKLKPHKVDWEQIERFLRSAEKKLASAKKILAFDEEACLQLAYEAMLKASLGFMFSHGFRARSQPGHHIAFGCESTRNMLVFSPCSTVSGGSETWLFMTTRDRFLARTRNELSRRPANIYELSAQTLTRGGRRAEGTADSSSDPRRVLLRMTTVQRIPGNGEH